MRKIEIYLQALEKHKDKKLKEIAEIEGLSYDYLRQIVSKLRRGLISPLNNNDHKELIVVGEGVNAPTEVSVMEVKEETSPYIEEILTPSLFWAMEEVILSLYRGEDSFLDTVPNLVRKQFPEFINDVDKILSLWSRADTILLRITDDLQTGIIKGAIDINVLRKRLLSLIDTLKNVAPEIYEKFDCQKPFSSNVIACAIMVYSSLKAEVYKTLNNLLLKIKARLDGMNRPLMLSGKAAALANRYELNIYAGNQLKTNEERDVQQLIAANVLNPNPLPNKLMNKFIDSAMEASGLDLIRQLDPTFISIYEESLKKYNMLQNNRLVKFRMEWMKRAIKGEEIKPAKLYYLCEEYLDNEEYLDHLPSPLFFVPNSYWKIMLNEDEALPSSILSGNIPLKPVPPKKLPLFMKEKQPVLNLVLAPSGSGKTVLFNALANYRIERYHAVIFRPTMPRDQDLGVIVPLGPYTPNLKKDYECLKQMHILPKSYNAIFLTIATSESDILTNQIWTVADRIYYVSSIEDFTLPWDKLYRELRKNGGGYLIVRSLMSRELTNKLRQTLLNSFFNWRGRIRPDARVVLQLDEVHELVPSVPYGEEAQLSHNLDLAFRDLRGWGIPLDTGTQRPNDIKQSLIESIIPTLFVGRFVETGRESTKTSRSRVETLMESLLYGAEKNYIPLVKKIMDNRDIQKLHLFFLILNGRLRLVRACMSPHVLESPGRNMRDVFKRAEELTGRQYLVSFNEVPTFELDSGSEERKSEGGEELPDFTL